MKIHLTLWTCCLSTIWLPSWICAYSRYGAPYRPPLYRMQQQQPMPLYIPYPFHNGQSNMAVALNSYHQDGDDDQTTTYQNGYDEDSSYRTPQSEKEEKTLEEQFFIIQPADAAAIALLNIVGIIMLALGSTVKIVGRRSVLGSDAGLSSEDDKESRRSDVIMEGLRLGSNGTHQMCIQRAACQQPKKAEVFASAAYVLIDVVNFGMKWIPVTPMQLSNMAVALHNGAASGNAGLRCDQKYPCSKLTLAT